MNYFKITRLAFFHQSSKLPKFSHLKHSDHWKLLFFFDFNLNQDKSGVFYRFEKLISSSWQVCFCSGVCWWGWIQNQFKSHNIESQTSLEELLERVMRGWKYCGSPVRLFFTRKCGSLPQIFNICEGLSYGSKNLRRSWSSKTKISFIKQIFLLTAFDKWLKLLTLPYCNFIWRNLKKEGTPISDQSYGHWKWIQARPSSFCSPLKSFWYSKTVIGLWIYNKSSWI